MDAKSNKAIEDLFTGRPDAYKFFQLIQEFIESIGPVKIEVTKTQVSFALRTKFAWVWLPQMWIKKRKEASITLTFSLRRHIQHERIKEAVEPRPGYWTHHVIIEKKSDFNNKVREWLYESYHLAEN